MPTNGSLYFGLPRTTSNRRLARRLALSRTPCEIIPDFFDGQHDSPQCVPRAFRLGSKPDRCRSPNAAGALWGDFHPPPGLTFSRYGTQLGRDPIQLAYWNAENISSNPGGAKNRTPSNRPHWLNKPNWTGPVNSADVRQNDQITRR